MQRVAASFARCLERVRESSSRVRVRFRKWVPDYGVCQQLDAQTRDLRCLAGLGKMMLASRLFVKSLGKIAL